ncbi:UNVERIFIED_CONTAM: hypothetical protein Sradi_0909100 [Sesamum radiatum]|uniref:Uncharacterized protein n=1 Tax=Sesamum radiatum TaxID=300843 RepID=A0AAW2V3I0_SESRA
MEATLRAEETSPERSFIEVKQKKLASNSNSISKHRGIVSFEVIGSQRGGYRGRGSDQTNRYYKPLKFGLELGEGVS